jgi:hypothetical protein
MPESDLAKSEGLPNDQDINDCFSDEDNITASFDNNGDSNWEGTFPWEAKIQKSNTKVFKNK